LKIFFCSNSYWVRGLVGSAECGRDVRVPSKRN